MSKEKESKKTLIARNKAARHEYEILETIEAGIVLTGTEVCSLRERNCQLSETFCLIRKGQAWIHGLHIHPYSHGNIANVDSDRKRKLLLHKRQIRYFDQKLKQQGFALIPLDMYFDSHSRVKLTLGLGKGKKLYDKRADMAKRDAERNIQRVMKWKNQRA